MRALYGLGQHGRRLETALSVHASIAVFAQREGEHAFVSMGPRRMHVRPSAQFPDHPQKKSALPESKGADMSNLIARAAAIVACAVLLPGAFGSSARAQTREPVATGSPTPGAFTAHAHGNVSVVTQGGTFSGIVRFGVAQRDRLIRIDVLDVKSDQLPIPPISVSAVIDRSSNTITMWNDMTMQYRTQSFVPSFGRSSPQPGATPPPARAARRGSSPIANLDVLSLTMKLTGHGTTGGLPSTGMSLDFQVQGKGATTAAHVSATAQLADEFPFFPMALDVTIEPGSPGLNAQVAYAVDDLTRELPPKARFTLPAGYTEARSFGDMIFQRRRMPAASPMPISSARPMPSPSASPR